MTDRIRTFFMRNPRWVVDIPPKKEIYCKDCMDAWDCFGDGREPMFHEKADENCYTPFPEE